MKASTPLLSSPREGKSSFTVSVVNLVNAIVGAGVLAIPFSYKSTGLILGLFLTFLIAVLSFASAWLLISSTTLAQKLDGRGGDTEVDGSDMGVGGSRYRSYRKLVHAAFGLSGSLLVEVFIIIFLLGACVSYIVILGEVMEPYLETWARSSRDHVSGSLPAWTGRWFPQVIASTCLLLPLSLVPTLHALRFTSSLAIVGIVFLILCVLIKFSGNLQQSLADEDDFFLRIWDHLWGERIMTSVPILCFAFTMHTQLMPVWDSLANPTVGRVKRLVAVSMTICCLAYMLVGTFGFLSFFDLTERNLLINYTSDPLIEVGKFAYVAIIVFSYPLMMYPARLAVENLVKACMPSNRRSVSGDEGIDSDDFDSVIARTRPVDRLPGCCAALSWRQFTEVLLLVFVTYFAAVFVPDISFIFGVVGATAGVFVVFIVPAAVHLKLHWMLYEGAQAEKSNSYPRTLSEDAKPVPSPPPRRSAILPLFLIACGALFSVGGLFETISERNAN